MARTKSREHGEALYDAINNEANEKFRDDGDDRPTRGAAKNAAQQLERLGEALVKLAPGLLAKVDIPGDLRAAVEEAQRIVAKGAHGGYRRQIQFIGKIMRTVEAEPIAAALKALAEEGTRQSVTVRLAETWRTRLLDDGDAAMEAFLREVKDIDRTALRQLTRAALDERTAGRPVRKQRELFRLLHAALSFRSDA
jgi:ribosome-associated protein